MWAKQKKADESVEEELSRSTKSGKNIQIQYYTFVARYATKTLFNMFNMSYDYFYVGRFRAKGTFGDKSGQKQSSFGKV